jgi:hypothetical protein
LTQVVGALVGTASPGRAAQAEHRQDVERQPEASGLVGRRLAGFGAGPGEGGVTKRSEIRLAFARDS